MENNKTPKIRFKGFTDPWEQRKFGDVGSVAMCKRIFKEQTSDEGDVPFYKIGTFGGEPDAYISQELFDEYKAKYPFPNKGDILISASGSIGRTVEFTGGNEYFQDSNIVWLKHGKDIDNSFLKILYNVVEWSCEGSTIKRLYNDNFLKTEFMLPNIDEQKKIGEYFCSLDNLITLHQRKYNKLLNVKKSMLEKMFPKNGSNIPEIRFKGFTDPWEQRKLKETIEYIVDNRGKNPDYYCSEGIPVIDNFMIRNSLYPDLNTATRFIDENLYQNFIRKYNEEDDILLTLVGNGIGNITLFPKDKAVIIQNTLGFRAKEDKKFLFFLLMANNEALVKLDRGMAQPSIRQDEILDLDIYVPSNSEQTQIGEYFSNLDNLITLHQRELEKLQNIKKSMLEKMFV